MPATIPRCGLCHFTFSTMQALQKHSKRKISCVQDHKCHKCGRMYTNENNKKSHEKACRGRKPTIDYATEEIEENNRLGAYWRGDDSDRRIEENDRTDAKPPTVILTAAHVDSPISSRVTAPHEPGKRFSSWPTELAVADGSRGPAGRIDAEASEDTADDNDPVGPAETSRSAPAPDRITDLRGGFSFLGHKIRKTKEDPPRVSVYDAIVAVTGQSRHAARAIYARLVSDFPETKSEVATNLDDCRPSRSDASNMYKFDGPRQRETPVTDAKGIVMIVNLLPGKEAANFRVASAAVMVRYLGGDDTLIAEIKANAVAQCDMPPDDAMGLFGQAVVASRAGESTDAIALKSAFEFNTRALLYKGLYLSLDHDVASVSLEPGQILAKIGRTDRTVAERNERHIAMHPKNSVLFAISTDDPPTAEGRVKSLLRSNKLLLKKVVRNDGTVSKEHILFHMTQAREVRGYFETACETVLADEFDDQRYGLLIEQEKTKQAEAEARKVEAETEARKAEAAVRSREIEFEMMKWNHATRFER